MTDTELTQTLETIRQNGDKLLDAFMKLNEDEVKALMPHLTALKWIQTTALEALENVHIRPNGHNV